METLIVSNPPGRVSASRGSLFMAWWGVISAMFYLYVGALVASVVGVRDAIIGLVLIVLIFGLINRIFARFSIQTEFNVNAISRIVFGHVGGILACLILAATGLYYLVFEGSIVAVALHAYTEKLFGWPLWAWYVVVAAYSVPLVLGGISNWMDRLNGVLLPLYVIGMITAVLWAYNVGEPANWTSYGGTLSVSHGGPGWLFAVAVYSAVFVLMFYTVEFAKNGRPADAKFHSNWTFGIPFYIATFFCTGLIGIFLQYSLRHHTGSAISEGGVAVALTQIMGIWAVLLILITQTRINSANLYIAAENFRILAGDLLHVRLNLPFWAVISGILMLLVMLTNIFGYILIALSWQAVFITGWVTIVLLHILKYRTYYKKESTTYVTRQAVWPALSAWLIGVAVGLGVVYSGAAWATTWAPVATILIAGGLYLMLGQPPTIEEGEVGAR